MERCDPLARHHAGEALPDRPLHDHGRPRVPKIRLLSDLARGAWNAVTAVINWIAERKFSPDHRWRREDWNRRRQHGRVPAALRRLAVRLARRARPDPRGRALLRVPDGRPRSARALDASARSRCSATRRIRCIRSAPTARRRRSSMRACWRARSARTARPRRRSRLRGGTPARDGIDRSRQSQERPRTGDAACRGTRAGRLRAHRATCCRPTELEDAAAGYKRIAGFDKDALNSRPSIVTVIFLSLRGAKRRGNLHRSA